MIICGGSTGGAVADTWMLNWREPGVDVAIDVRPGSSENPVNPNARGVLPVAILGAPGFDLRALDFTGIRVGGASVTVLGNGRPKLDFEDVNGDGIEDLLSHVEMTALDFENAPRDAEGLVTIRLEAATLLENELVRGQDRVRVVPDPRRGQGLENAGVPDGLLESFELVTNPADGSVSAAIRIGPLGADWLEVYDLLGRRVERRDLSTLGPGTHVLELGAGSGFRPGVYLARVSRGAQEMVRRFVLIR
jgi:hypothetical protein